MIDRRLLVLWCSCSFLRATLIVWLFIWWINLFITICDGLYLWVPSFVVLVRRVAGWVLIFWFVVDIVFIHMILVFSHKPSIDFFSMVFMWVFRRWRERQSGSYWVGRGCWCVVWVIVFTDWRFIVCLGDDFSPSPIGSACCWFPSSPSTTRLEERGLFLFAIPICDSCGSRARCWIGWDATHSYIFKYLTDKLYLYLIPIMFHLSSNLSTLFCEISPYFWGYHSWNILRNLLRVFIQF